MSTRTNLTAPTYHALVSPHRLHPAALCTPSPPIAFLTRKLAGSVLVMLGAASGGAFAIFRLDEKYDQTPAMLLAPIGLLLWCVGWSLLFYPLIRRIHWLLRLPAIAILVPVIPIGLIVVSVLILLGFMCLYGLL